MPRSVGRYSTDRTSTSQEGHSDLTDNKIDNNGFGPIQIDSSKYDVVIVADFGHGFCDQLQIEDGFHLMCQTNSYNFGFNRLSKWKNHIKNSVCLDLREASLQINRKMSDCKDTDAIDIFNYEIGCDNLFVTLGGSGALYTNGREIKRHKVIKSNIADTIGAGDTFFAFASLMAHLNVSDNDKLKLPSLAASLSTTWICNEESVTQEKLIKYAHQKVQ